MVTRIPILTHRCAGSSCQQRCIRAASAGEQSSGTLGRRPCWDTCRISCGRENWLADVRCCSTACIGGALPNACCTLQWQVPAKLWELPCAMAVRCDAHPGTEQCRCAQYLARSTHLHCGHACVQVLPSAGQLPHCKSSCTGSAPCQAKPCTCCSPSGALCAGRGQGLAWRALLGI